MKAGEQWQVLSEHNGLGQEIVRTFLHNGAIRFSQRMTWRGDGRLISKANYQDGQLKSTERFVYDVLDRLKGYTCDSDDAAYCPTNASGDAVKAQAFIWDALDNIVTNVTTRFDGTQHTQDFSYDANADPTRMTSVQHGSQSRVLSWSDNGYLVDDGQGHAFSYTGTGQVSRVNDAEGQLLSRYQYDGHQRLVAQYVEQDESIRELRYDGDELIGEIWFDKTCAVTRRTSISAGLAEYEGDQVRWLIDDPQVGIAGQVRDGGLTLAPRLPFGEGALLEGVVSGYNGMRRDPVTGQYPAGNGYRSYDPGIGRYAQPDWLAPFGDSGHNPYQHCPDPVNLHDPSGAIMLSRWGRTVSAGARGAIAGDQERGAGGKWRGLALSFVLTVLGGGDGVFGGGLDDALRLFDHHGCNVLWTGSGRGVDRRDQSGVVQGAGDCVNGNRRVVHAGLPGVMKASLKLLNATKNLVQRTVRWGERVEGRQAGLQATEVRQTRRYAPISVAEYARGASGR
jgi:RHS repeat-associated protein